MFELYFSLSSLVLVLLWGVLYNKKFFLSKEGYTAEWEEATSEEKHKFLTPMPILENIKKVFSLKWIDSFWMWTIGGWGVCVLINLFIMVGIIPELIIVPVIVYASTFTMAIMATIGMKKEKERTLKKEKEKSEAELRKE